MYIIELVPPEDPSSLQKYYSKISSVINRTNRISIASKPSEQSISGFEKSVNLVRFLRDVEPDLDILFHLTCRDLDKDTIRARLALLRDLKISKILVVTGDRYVWSPSNTSAYENSRQLLREIVKLHHNWFDVICVAGYPGGNRRQSHDNRAECERLSAAIEMGATCVLTQCIFAAGSFKEFSESWNHLHPDVEVIPSVALFKTPKDLERIIHLTRVDATGLADLMSHLKALDFQRSEEYCLEHIADTCNRLRKRCRTIDICTFGHFDLAKQLIEKLQAMAPE